MRFPQYPENAPEMRALGRELAEHLGPGAAVALEGDLGAGKTELVKGLAQGLGYEGVVTSPTFTLLHEYRGGRVPLLHFDFYRIGHGAELLDLGWDDLVEEGVLAVEWAGRFPNLLPAGTVWLVIEILPDGRRRVSRHEAASHPAGETAGS